MNVRNISSGLQEASRFEHINAYLIDGSGLIDPGIGYNLERNINPKSVDEVLITFACSEHYAILDEYDFGEVTVYVRDSDNIDIDSDYRVVEVSDGDKISLGNKEFGVIERTGLMASIGAYNRESKILFSGHLFIENQEMIEAEETKQNYLHLLERLKETDIEEIMPPHGSPIPVEAVNHEIDRTKNIECDREKIADEFRTGNSMARHYEHEWNRNFNNPFRNYMPNEKWLFYGVNPEHGLLKTFLGGLLNLSAGIYMKLQLILYSDDYIEEKYSKPH